MSMLIAASCGADGITPQLFDVPPQRLSRYWDKLERQLRQHVRPVDADEPLDDDGVDPDYQPEYDPDHETAESDLPDTTVVDSHGSSRRVKADINATPDSRFDPARMSESDFAEWQEAELWNDSQPVIDFLRRFVRTDYKIRVITRYALDSEGRIAGEFSREDKPANGIRVSERIAYSRLSVSGESAGYKMPAPCHCGAPANRLGDSTRYASESFRDLAIYLRFLASRLDLEAACGS